MWWWCIFQEFPPADRGIALATDRGIALATDRVSGEYRPARPGALQTLARGSRVPKLTRSTMARTRVLATLAGLAGLLVLGALAPASASALDGCAQVVPLFGSTYFTTCTGQCLKFTWENETPHIRVYVETGDAGAVTVGPQQTPDKDVTLLFSKPGVVTLTVFDTARCDPEPVVRKVYVVQC